MKKNRLFVVIPCFIVNALVIFLLFCYCLSSIYIGEASLLDRLSLNYKTNERGGWGQTLRRFSEIEEYENIDILFAGSSHAYRGFDPRLFAAKGLTSFNMGTSAQTPLNTYFLLKRYLPTLKPKLIVLELYPEMLAVDGFESFKDLSVNLTISKELFEMAFELKSLQSFKILFSDYLKYTYGSNKYINQRPIEDENYIQGGYCETFIVRSKNELNNSVKCIYPIDLQIKYLKKIFEYSKKKNIDMLIVVQPIPDDVRSKIENYKKLSSEISDLSKNYGVDFIDFNHLLKLDSIKDFKDDDHVNANGVRKFNLSLIKFFLNTPHYQDLLNLK